ncbi:MAG: peptidoglycan DD-metalloendopeptidase family protein [Gammaproteobacteria bacterium]|nr:peptidoglycan DD-metalloendopeptidase family protein [Gammaproteobacteria bacterium]
MRSVFRAVLLCWVGILMLVGCAGALRWNPPAPAGGSGVAEPLPRSYVVKPGDTLYSIAWRFGLDYHDVAAWNDIGADYLIHPGRQLALVAPLIGTAGARVASSPPRPVLADTGFRPSSSIHWMWPAAGAVIRQFHADNTLSKGIDINGALGTDIRAAAAGKVVYTGSGIIGYGKLIIIKNSEELLSAYADNDQLLVKEGDVVKAGDRIATMGLGRDGQPLLHFEIRYNGKPVNPLGYLPRR